MEIVTCKACGGDLNRVGNYNICRFCGSKWIIDESNDVHVVERALAWTALRNSDFESAVELFENILLKDPENHEACWGMALSLHGIIYVTDLNEYKKVPTCNNISEFSFLNDKYVQKAISLAPSDLVDTYKKQAEDIERIRVEWLEKARKEPPYDVFISFKDSDREHGIERTQDSIDAQDLYNALVSEGYKVFFSRISLRDKVSEHYEPYIYNAIKTAKVMIVFGEKPEYFSSTWIKNEWSRFKTRIENGEKHKNSLVVAYKNMDPADLPVVLKSRQCLNVASMTFFSDLTRHIKRVIEESNTANSAGDGHSEQSNPANGHDNKKRRKKKLKWTLAILATLVVTITAVFLVINPFKTEKKYQGFHYVVNSDMISCTITGFDSSDITSTRLYIPDRIKDYTVRVIGDYAFSYCSSLTSITIPDSVTSIGNWAFYGCSSLTSITIPDSVTSIGDYEFEYCSSLTSITIPDSVTSIGNSAFYGCSSLTSITTPDSITSIGDEAFSGCSSLTSITISDSVTSICRAAFYGCSSLTNVYYAATAIDWRWISIDDDNDYLTYATRYYYSETQPMEVGNYWHYVDGVPTVWENN